MGAGTLWALLFIAGWQGVWRTYQAKSLSSVMRKAEEDPEPLQHPY